MKLKITFALIFLFLSTLFIQAQDSLHDFMYRNSFMELNLKYPDSLNIIGIGDVTTFIWEEGGPRHYKTFLHAEKAIYIDIIISHDDFFQTARNQDFVLLEGVWFDSNQLKKIKRNNLSENITIEDWRGIRVGTEWDRSVLFPNELIQKGYRYLISKKFGNTNIYISADQRNAPDLRNILQTICKSISLTLELHSINKRKVYNTISDVDFLNMEYTLYDIEELPDVEKTKVTVKDGKYFETTDKVEWTIYSFVVYDLSFGDVTGDGNEDAVIISSENLGGTGHFDRAHIFSLVNGKPKLIYRYEGGDRADGGIDTAYIKNGLLYISQYDGFDGLCCPEYLYTIGYEWNGKDLVQQTCKEYGYTTEIAIRDTLSSEELIKGITFTDSVQYRESYLLELKKGQTLLAEATNLNQKFDVFLVLTNTNGEVLSGCKEIRINKINFKVPSSDYYYLRIHLEYERGRYKASIKVK